MFGELLRNLAGKAGSAIQTVGNFRPAALGGFSPNQIAGTVAPNFTLSSSLQNYGGNRSGQSFAWVPRAEASTGSVQGTTTYSGPSSTTMGPLSTGYGGNPLGSGSGTYNPSTGGQGPAVGGDVGSYTDGGGESGQDDQAYLQSLRDAFSGLRSSVESQLPGIESTYNTVKGDIEGAVGRAKEVYGERKEDIGRGFGENLRNLLQTDRELGQKTRNTYSGLNALDSSSFAEAENKRQQSVFDTQGSLTRDKERQYREAEREYSAYETEATRALAGAAQEYQGAKGALQAALAQNKLDEAYSIQNAMQQIQDRARQIQDSVNAFKLNLAQLQASGTNVIGNLQQFGRGGLDNIYNQYLGKTYNPGMSRLSFSRPEIGGSGYIGSGGDDEKRRLFT
jgi:hypothetical protein